MTTSRIAQAGAIATGGALLAWSAVAHADFALNMTPGATAISHEVYGLHMLIFWILSLIHI